MTNRLILQLGLLRKQLQVPWATITEISEKLNFSVPCLFNIVKQTLKNIPDDPSELGCYLDTERDFVYPKDSPFCRAFGITRAFLLDSSDAVPPQACCCHIPNGLLIELDRFKCQNNLILMKGNVVHRCLKAVCPAMNVSTKALSKRLEKLKEDFRKHQRQ
jgi:hypothetical protein